MTIYIIGDSHVSVFSGNGTIDNPFMLPLITRGNFSHIKQWIKTNTTSNFIPLRVGAYTAYNFSTKLPNISNTLKEMKCRNDDLILISAGEVDCRIHLAREILNGRDMYQVVNECVTRYINALHVLKKHTKLQIGVWAPPCTLADQRYSGSEPCYGDEILRNQILHMFNQLLSESCKTMNIPCISIYSDIMDINTFRTNVYYQQDWIHLSQTAMPLIIKKIDEWIECHS